ncbi:FHS family L-fucose permease-like MFS transporter [Tenacibaculum adriaticum]|uniref:FHS family L-fucose permease-like MFS transporter n=1 Tax=Tenacibaculum adriaticum TaxID=413713 RepID=A0A5S5DTU3_9FLAO|nr:sugar MFS transporter [Tenacibaculum adriaticum]TYP99370.1 FHS family L-fucose permease-like MFS transporter [Tenacibaculum adriaticum]
MIQKNSYNRAFIFLTSLFFLWGFITVLVDSLVPRLKDVFTLTYFQAGLVQFAFFGAYFVLSIPAGYILSKIGYKKGIILGLGTMATGCLLFYPAASYRTFGIFMLAYFVLAGGMTILQVAANPYVAVLGDESGASSRLNLSQAFNSLGTAIAPAIGAMFLLSDTIKTSEEIETLTEVQKQTYLISEAEAVQSPFLLIAGFIIVLAIIFVFVQLPKILQKTSKSGYSDLLKKKSLVLGAIGIFVYVGAEVSIGSYLVSYFLDMDLALAIKNSSFFRNISETILSNDVYKLDNKAVVGAFVTFYWSGAMIGRFIGAYLTKIMNPAKVLGYFAIGAVSMILISMNTTGFIAMISILAVGLFNSIMFPTIFSLAIGGLEELKPQASGILCTMIVGGAIIPPLYGFFIDHGGFKKAFILIILCYAYIFFYGNYKRKQVA